MSTIEELEKELAALRVRHEKQLQNKLYKLKEAKLKYYKVPEKEIPEQEQLERLKKYDAEITQALIKVKTPQIVIGDVNLGNYIVSIRRDQTFIGLYNKVIIVDSVMDHVQPHPNIFREEYVRTCWGGYWNSIQKLHSQKRWCDLYLMIITFLQESKGDQYHKSPKACLRQYCNKCGERKCICGL